MMKGRVLLEVLREQRATVVTASTYYCCCLIQEIASVAERSRHPALRLVSFVA